MNILRTPLFVVLSVLMMGAAPPPDINVAETLSQVKKGAPEASVIAKIRKVKSSIAVPVIIELLRDRDERMRRVASRALANYRAKDVSEALLMRLHDPAPSVVIAAANSLLHVRANKMVEAITTLLGHPSIKVRCQVAEMLSKKGGRKGATALKVRLGANMTDEEKACLLGPLVPHDRKYALAGAVPLLRKPVTRELGAAVFMRAGVKALEGLSRGLDSGLSDELIAASLDIAQRLGAPGVRWIAAQITGKYAEVRDRSLDVLLSRASETLVIELLSSISAKANTAVRAQVVNALTKQGNKALLPQLRRWVAGQPPLIREAASRGLGRLKDRSSAALLLRSYLNEREVLSPQNLDVRVAMIEAMGELKKAQWVPVFLDSLGVKGEERVATEALVKVGKPAVRTLILAIKVGDTRRIPFVVEALARIGDGVGKAAQGLFRHPLETIRILARDLMAASGDPKAVQSLLKLFRSDQVKDPVPVIEAIATFGTDEAQKGLIEACSHAEEAARLAAVKGLGEGHVRSKAVLDQLAQTLETDRSIDVRIAAMRSLFRLGSEQLVPMLLKLIQFEGPDIRTEAYEVLGWSGVPDAVPVLADRLADAQDERERKNLLTALHRLTRRTDLRSAGGYQDWHANLLTATGGRFQGVSRQSTTRAGRKLYYRVVGKGPVVIAVAGHHSGDIWRPALDLLASKYTIVTYDARGRGQSDMGSGALTYADEARDIDAIRKAVKAKKVRIVAHDVGGIIGAAYARMFPKRVKAMVFISTPPRIRGYEIETIAARTLKKKQAQDLTALDERHAWFHPVAWLKYRQAALSPALVNNAKLAPRVQMNPTDPFVRQRVIQAVSKLGLSSLLPPLRVPVLLVVGANAPFSTSALSGLTRLAKKNRHIKFVRPNALGHYPHLESPAEAARIIGGGL